LAPDLCGEACVNTDVSQQHCGRCGHACSAGFTCGAGECRKRIVRATRTPACATVCANNGLVCDEVTVLWRHYSGLTYLTGPRCDAVPDAEYMYAGNYYDFAEMRCFCTER
jgi:hypothetical protein